MGAAIMYETTSLLKLPAYLSQDIRKKLVDLKRAALKANTDSTHPQTGGGPKPDRPWFTDVILDILGQDSCLVSGISGKGVVITFILLLGYGTQHAHTYH